MKFITCLERWISGESPRGEYDSSEQYSIWLRGMILNQSAICKILSGDGSTSIISSGSLSSITPYSIIFFGHFSDLSLTMLFQMNNGRPSLRASQP